MSQKTKDLLGNLDAALYSLKNAGPFELAEKAILLAEATRNVMRDLDARLSAIESGAAL